MVCNRCILAIQNVLTEMGITPVSIHLGEVDFGDVTPEKQQIEEFADRVQSLGFEIISDKKSQLIEKIKNAIIVLVQNPQSIEKTKLSEYLSERLFHDYTYLSNLFSSVEGVTIEQYFINQKIEKVKELLVYDELTLTEISYRLGYSSVSHLSRQFKKVTGQTPSEFKTLRDTGQRKSLDKV